MAVGVVNLFPLQQLHSLSSNCHCFCTGFFFSIKDLCLRVLYISSVIFAPSSGSPSPSFLLGGVDIQLHFSTVSKCNISVIIFHLPQYFFYTYCTMSCDCHKRNSVSIAVLQNMTFLSKPPYCDIWEGYFGSDVSQFKFVQYQGYYKHTYWRCIRSTPEKLLKKAKTSWSHPGVECRADHNPSFLMISSRT